jgi:hypothetical protein
MAMISLIELRETYLNLQLAWPDKWPGLPIIFDQCVNQLGWDLSAMSALPQTFSLYHCSKELAEFIEENGKSQFDKNQEPAYHSRLHIADTIVGLTALLLAQRSANDLDVPTQSHLEMLAMTAMLGHDLMHDGSINTYPEELETKSIHYLRPFLTEQHVPGQDIKLIEKIILMTDPAKVALHHTSIKNIFFDIQVADCLGILLQEADILASCFEDIGRVRTSFLAKEWSHRFPSKSKLLITRQGRLNFLETNARFSSPASHILGTPEIVTTQIQSIHSSLIKRNLV